jgi:hypothetical protein
LELQKTLTNLFALNSTNLSLSAAKTELTSLFQQIGLDTSTITQYTEQVAALKAVLVSNPDAAQSLAISTEIGNYIKSAESTISAQPGLANFQNDSEILLDPQFNEFNTLYALVVKNSNLLKQNPGNALVFFITNASAGAAHFFVLLSEASQKAAAKKALTSKFKN